MQIAIDKISPNPDQPRTVFDEDELLGLAQSIQENGLIQPVVVEKHGSQFLLVDGERRWRAVKLLGWPSIEAVVRPASNHRGEQRVTQALVANVQRSQLGPVDEARVYQRLMKDLKSQDAFAARCGVSNATISSRLALLSLPEPVQKVFNLGRVAMDLGTMARLKRLTAQQQEEIVLAGAARGWKGQAYSTAISRALKQSGTKYKPRSPRAEPQEKITGHYSALALVESTEGLSPAIVGVARKTCQACPLYEEASRMVCKQCPLPDFLNRLQKEEKK